MLWLLLWLFLAIVVAGLVVVYVAYPHRGEEVPYLPVVGEKMRRAVDSLPVLEEDEARLLRR